MSERTSDPTLDRLFRHSAWATARTIAHLATLPDETLALAAPGGYGTIGATLRHLVSSQNYYIARLEGLPEQPELPDPTRAADLAALAANAERSSAILRELAARGGERELTWSGYGWRETWPASVILAQVIHHATEHRAQIFAALTAHGIAGPSLDDLDLWAHEAELTPGRTVRIG